jgi:hypothetical protein
LGACKVLDKEACTGSTKRGQIWGIKTMPCNARQISLFEWLMRNGVRWLAFACAKPCKFKRSRIPLISQVTSMRLLGAKKSASKALKIFFDVRKIFQNSGKY